MKETKQDSIVLITPSQLKETNLIFAEHQKLLIENNLLIEEIANYKLDNELLMETDSINKARLRAISEFYSSEIDNLNKEISKKDKSILRWKIGSVTVGIGLILWLLLK